jgi:hypothetical protein
MFSIGTIAACAHKADTTTTAQNSEPEAAVRDVAQVDVGNGSLDEYKVATIRGRSFYEFGDYVEKYMKSLSSTPKFKNGNVVKTGHTTIKMAEALCECDSQYVEDVWDNFNRTADLIRSAPHCREGKKMKLVTLNDLDARFEKVKVKMSEFSDENRFSLNGNPIMGYWYAKYSYKTDTFNRICEAFRAKHQEEIENDIKQKRNWWARTIWVKEPDFLLSTAYGRFECKLGSEHHAPKKKLVLPNLTKVDTDKSFFVDRMRYPFCVESK